MFDLSLCRSTRLGGTVRLTRPSWMKGTMWMSIWPTSCSLWSRLYRPLQRLPAPVHESCALCSLCYERQLWESSQVLMLVYNHPSHTCTIATTRTVSLYPTIYLVSSKAGNRWPSRPLCNPNTSVGQTCLYPRKLDTLYCILIALWLIVSRIHLTDCILVNREERDSAVLCSEWICVSEILCSCHSQSKALPPQTRLPCKSHCLYVLIEYLSIAIVLN